MSKIKPNYKNFSPKYKLLQNEKILKTLSRFYKVNNMVIDSNVTELVIESIDMKLEYSALKSIKQEFGLTVEDFEKR